MKMWYQIEFLGVSLSNKIHILHPSSQQIWHSRKSCAWVKPWPNFVQKTSFSPSPPKLEDRLEPRKTQQFSQQFFLPRQNGQVTLFAKNSDFSGSLLHVDICLSKLAMRPTQHQKGLCILSEKNIRRKDKKMFSSCLLGRQQQTTEKVLNSWGNFSHSLFFHDS